MARFYAHPYSALLIRTLLIKLILTLIVVLQVQGQSAPTISGFSPVSGKVGDEIIIQGSGFLTANMVYVGSESTLDFTIVSDSQIKVNVPASASTGRIQVHNSFGARSSTTNYTVTSAPIISSISPTTGPVGTEVTISGSKFTGVASISIAGGSVTDFIVISDTEIKAVISETAYGGVARVTANHGSATSAQNFEVTDLPTVTNFTPPSGPVGTAVRIYGTKFNNATSINIAGGTTTDFTIVNDTEIRVKVPANAIGGTVRVYTNTGTGISSSSFTVNGTPSLTSFTPASARAGAEVTINGSGFTTADRVYFGSGSITDFTIVNDFQIKAIVPNTATTGKVQVYTSQGRVTSIYNFAVEGAPVISSFSPTSGPVGTVVTIRGRNFNDASTVLIGSASITNFTIVSDSEIQVVVPSVASSGIVRVYSNSGRALSSGQFTLDNAPVISTFTPTSGPTGTEITITGENFTGTNLIYVGSGSTTNFTVVSDTQLKVMVPATATTGKLIVRTATGQVTSKETFTLTGAPEIHSFTPAAGPVNTTVTIKGINFTGATLVYFGSGTTTNFTVVSDTEIKVVVPTTAATGIIRVYTPSGRANSSTNFTLTGAPVISTFTPTSGPTGTEITITGENFTGTNLIYVGSGSTTNFTVVSDTQLKVMVPATATTGKLIVRTATGQVTSKETFTLTGAPEIHSFTPAAGPVNTTVTIKGINFTGATLVYFGSGTTTNFTVVSDTEIKAVVPALASTGIVQVRTPNGRANSSGYFTVSGAPAITSFTPISGPVGTEIIITGENFTGTNRVYVGSGNTTTGFTVVSDTQLKVIVPATASNGSLIVRTANGQVTSTVTYKLSPAYLSTTKPEVTFKLGQAATEEYNVDGLGLKNGESVTINVAANSPFEISTNAGSGFGKSVTLNNVVNHRLVPTAIYVKYTPDEANTTTAAEIVHVQGTTAERKIRVEAITPLPVELKSFTAKLINGAIHLDWSTASEKDNSHFDIEMSSGNANNYRKVARVDSKVGTSSLTTHYSYTINYSGNGQTEYYRLKQVDIDGTATYSRPVAIRPVMATKPTQVAPNPITTDSKIYLTAQQNGIALIKVSSIRGKQIYVEQVQVQVGENALPLSKYNNLMSGIYIVTIELDGKQEFFRIMKH
ncbi:IPT/TIG domain-containing protein [Pontibacter burrus]|uniref:T9SS type A sorting domain-containing protein n=1 Tax=Pontibacter burrus TaxID=2704466 RepID=A0A6B3LMX2_9BACT|nr:IPT/TIG domain-containing protein [Pontibacter burrus]NEM96415.1 T9SS type A sorting domain-containing protein [Pontibacter burrus]